MSKLKKYKEKIQKQQQKKEKSFESSQLLPIVQKKLIYGSAIFVLSEVTNWILGSKILHQMFFRFVKYFEIDILYEKASYEIGPLMASSFRPEFLAAIGDYIWLATFALFSMGIGALYTYIHEKNTTFNTVLSISIVVCFLKFVLFSVPYGMFQVLPYLVDFVSKFYFEPMIIFPACFVFLFVGSEIMTFWIKNFGEEQMRGKYL